MAGLGYRLPGTRITEVTQPTTVNISSSQRIPCFIGMASDYIVVSYESVVRSSSGYVDSLVHTEDTVHEIIQVGSQRGLNDYVEEIDFDLTNSEIVWTSTGVTPVAGATYYVSYTYDRKYNTSTGFTDPNYNDYRYKEFTNFEDVIADLGEDIPANTLVNIAKIALSLFNVPKIATVQVKTGSSGEYLKALDLIKYRNIQTVIPLTSNATIRGYVITHVTERSLPDNGMWRMAWFGSAIGTPVGDEDDLNSIRGIASTIANELCMFINVPRAKYYYNDPDTKEELYTVVDGSFVAAVLGAYRDAFSYPATTLLNRNVTGVELYEDDFDDYYSDYQLTLCGGSSVFIVRPVSGAMQVVDDLTTDNSTVERNNINIITAKHYISKDVVIQMDRTFKGRLITDSGSYTNTVSAYLAAMFAAYKRAMIIESVGTIKVTIDPTRRDTILIFYSYRSVYTHKYSEGTYALVV